jgi:hypothetical protein
VRTSCRSGRGMTRWSRRRQARASKAPRTLPSSVWAQRADRECGGSRAGDARDSACGSRAGASPRARRPEPAKIAAL